MSTTNTQQNVSSASLLKERPVWGRLWLLGLLAIVGSVIVNAIIHTIAMAVLPISSQFFQLQGPIYVVFTVVATIAAVLVFALVSRLSRRPIRLYRIIATIVLVLSLIPDLGLLSSTGGSWYAVGTLMSMHIAAYLVCVGVLTTMTRTHVR